MGEYALTRIHPLQLQFFWGWISHTGHIHILHRGGGVQIDGSAPEVDFHVSFLLEKGSQET